MNNLIKINPYSFVNRDFLWVCEYFNGDLFPEYDFKTYKKNDFYDINKNQTIRFGYLGHGYHFYFDTYSGIFHLLGNDISFYYKTEGRLIPLTNNKQMYNDLISYKTVYSDAFNNNCNIEKYSFGYKTQLINNDIKFNFKPIMHLPNGEKAYFTVWLVSNYDLDGELCIYLNSLPYQSINAPLKANHGGELRWIINL